MWSIKNQVIVSNQTTSDIGALKYPSLGMWIVTSFV